MFISLALVLLLLAPVTASEVAPAQNALVIDFYYVPSCPSCQPVIAFTKELAARYADRVVIRRHNITADEAAFDIYIDRLEAIKADSTPKLAAFINRTALLGGKAIREQLEAAIDKALNQRLKSTSEHITAPEAQKQRQERQESKNRTSWGMVIAAGLADGINPCAFATAILFIALLRARRRKRQEIIAVGAAFITAVFLTYFVIGLVFYRAMALLTHLHSLTLVIGWGAVLMALTAGIFSVVDALRSLRPQGQTRMILVLPTRLKRAIKGRLRATATAQHLVLSAALAGSLIALLESACTGQVYFPLILGIVREADGWPRGLTLLAGYNLCFILPLILLFGVTYFGCSSTRIAELTRRTLWISKLCLAAVFFAMGYWLSVTLI